MVSVSQEETAEIIYQYVISLTGGLAASPGLYLMSHIFTIGDFWHSGRRSRAVVGRVLVVSQDCAMLALLPLNAADLICPTGTSGHFRPCMHWGTGLSWYQHYPEDFCALLRVKVFTTRKVFETWDAPASRASQVPAAV